MSLARNIRPNPIIRDPRAEALLVFVTLRPDLDGAGAPTWLERASALVGELEAQHPKGRVASVVTALGAPSSVPRLRRASGSIRPRRRSACASH